MKERIKRLIAWAKATLPFRVFTRFSNRNGNLLAAGMSYQSIFAVFAAVWVGFSVAGIYVRANPEIYTALVDVINKTVPGLIGGAISEKALDSATVTLSITGVIALLGLVMTAVGWIDSTRLAIRALFDLGKVEQNVVIQKLVDFGLAAAFGVGLIASAVVSVVSTQLVTLVLGWVGIEHDSIAAVVVARIIGYAVVVALNLATLMAMYRLLVATPIPPRVLVEGAGMAAIGLGVLSALSGLLLGGAGKNPLLASFAAIIALLIWFNFICRVILLGGAFIAERMSDLGLFESIRAQAEVQRMLAEAKAAVAEARKSLREADRWGDRRRARKALRDANRRLLEAGTPPTGDRVGGRD